MSTGHLILFVVQWCAGAWLLARVPAPEESTSPPLAADDEAPRSPGSRATVSVIVPARNEETSLPHLLASLATQTRRPSEVIVVDDHSEDATAALAAASGATVLDAPPLAAGWLGKPAACTAGAAVATGDVLLFLDADVTLGPGALAAVVDEHRRRGGLVSVQPYHVTVRAYERLSAICNVVAMMGTLGFTAPPRHKVAMAFGPCLITGRADYDALGGHTDPTVRSQVIEDIALARIFRAAGRPVAVLGGRTMVRFRMYPGGVRQLVDGWTRSLGIGARGTSPVAIIGPFLWIWGALVAAWYGLEAVVGSPHRIVDAVVYFAWAIQIGWMLRRVGRFGVLTAVFFPVPLVAFVAMFVRSGLLLVTRRRVRWRGRLVRGAGN
ncbi:MAG: glycosyltransferase [Actinomycetota bacterium]|nr:glycosyltransferase [Actinomycetota bacterium]